MHLNTTRSPHNKKTSIQQQKRQQIEQKTFETQTILIENNVSKITLQQAGPWLSRSQYDDIVTERSCEKRCGYPLCSAPLPPPPKERFRIHRPTNTIYDLTERNMYCSDVCYIASKFYRQQLSDEPAYLRSESLSSSPQQLPKLLDPTEIDQKQNKTLEAKIQEALQAQDTRPNFTIIEHFNTDNNTSLTEPSLSSSLNTTQSLTVTTTNTIINSNNNKYESNDKNQKRIESKRGVVTVKDEDIASLSHQPEVTFQFSQPSNSLSPTTTTTTTATTSSSSSSSTSTIRSRDTLTNSETRLVEVTSQSENSESMSDTESGSDIDPNELFYLFLRPSKKRIELPPLSNFATLWMCLESWVTKETRQWLNNSIPSHSSSFPSKCEESTTTLSNTSENETPSRILLPPVDNLAPEILRQQSLFAILLPFIKKLEEEFSLEVKLASEIQSLISTFDFSRQPIPSLANNYWMLLTLLFLNLISRQHEYFRDRLTEENKVQIMKKYNICKEEFDVYMQLFHNNS